MTPDQARERARKIVRASICDEHNEIEPQTGQQKGYVVLAVLMLLALFGFVAFVATGCGTTRALITCALNSPSCN